jgi:hypothetical protein
MKKLLTIAALLGVASLSYGQGYVSFVNSSSTRFSTNAPGNTAGNGFTAVGPGTAGMFYFELFAAPSTQNTISSTTDPTLNGWTAVHSATNTPSGGRLSGLAEDGGAASQIPGFANGSTADFAVVGWSASIGTTWAEAQTWWNNGNPLSTASGYFGINTSVANDIQLAPSGGPYPTLFDPVASGFMHGWGLSSYAVPEPSTFALAGLGAAAMLIFRRRKA